MWSPDRVGDQVRGGRKPCDPAIVVFVPDSTGGATLVTDKGHVYAKARTAIDAVADEGRRMRGRVSHFATCPNAKEHRKGTRDDR